MSFLSDNKLLCDMASDHFTHMLQLERTRAPKERRKTSLVDGRLAFDVFYGKQTHNGDQASSSPSLG